MNMVDPEELGIKPFGQVVHEYSGYQSLTDVPKTLVYNEPCKDYRVNKGISLFQGRKSTVQLLEEYLSFVKNLFLQEYAVKPTWEILEAYKFIDGYYARCQLLGFLMKREGSDFQIDGNSIREHLLTLNAQSGVLRLWAAVRYASSLLFQLVDSISPYITTILVNGKQVSSWYQGVQLQFVKNLH